ncbi:unnamed protein product [Effrenium voratum]|uniref:Hint domain-containing protein n=1 Tax=Effrenium voratum TaxID=2562239 RepID=A0AA36HKT5_9DINO|nr:unnamed protein product [Effrenium voratum]
MGKLPLSLACSCTMAPSEFAWKLWSDVSECWAAEAFRGAVLRKCPAGGEAWAQLREVRGNTSTAVSRVTFRADGACQVLELFFMGFPYPVGEFRSCGEVRWRWEKAGGRWKVWVESDTGETVVVPATFEASAPQLELHSLSPDRLEVSLLPLQQVRSPQPSQAELRVQELMAEVQHERAQKANLQQQCDELKEQLTTIAQDKARAVQAKYTLEYLICSRSWNSPGVLTQEACKKRKRPAKELPDRDAKAARQRESRDESASDGSSRSAKCFLPNTALPGADGHLLRVQHLEPGQQVRLADGAEASVVHVKKHMASRKPYDLVELSTDQGIFTISKDHRVAVTDGTGIHDQRADSLKPGDSVIVGKKDRKLTRVSTKKERTELYEITFETDGPIEMFHVREFGMLTFGSAPDASGSDGRIPTNAAEAMLQCVGSPSCEVEE